MKAKKSAAKKTSSKTLKDIKPKGNPMGGAKTPVTPLIAPIPDFRARRSSVILPELTPDRAPRHRLRFEGFASARRSEC